MQKEDPFYEHYAQICKTIGNPVRQQIIETIGQNELNVTEIRSKLGIGLSNLSNHLSILFQAGILNKKKDGSFIRYSLTQPELVEALAKIKTVIAAIFARKSRMLSGSGAMPPPSASAPGGMK